MESIISLRAFAIDDPQAAEHWGLLGETEGDTWTHSHDAIPEQYAEAFQQFADGELDAIDTHRPEPQRVYGGVAVVLDELVLRVTEGEMEHEFRLATGRDLADGQTICSASHDVETGITAQSIHDDTTIANAVQRAADALDHRIQWLDVISPRSLSGVVDAAEELVGDE